MPVTAPCVKCGMPVTRPASMIAKSKRTFCGVECYRSTRGQNYRPHRQGQRKARAIVSQYFDLQQQHIVHHEDSDNDNNALDNLKVFANQSDHMKYHHGTPVAILFDGSKVLPTPRSVSTVCRVCGMAFRALIGLEEEQSAAECCAICEVSQ